MEKFYSVKELTQLLSISKPTIYRWVREGRIPYYKVNGYLIRFREKDIKEWIEKFRKEENRPEYTLN